MKTELRRRVVVRRDGVIEIEAIELREGMTADVIVRVDTPADRVREAHDLFTATQAVPSVRAITEQDIADEIAAYRASRG